MATIAVVGNARSLLEKNYGKLIDSHDIVVRFNEGVPIDKKAQGSKTDLVVTYHINKWNNHCKKLWPDGQRHYIIEDPYKLRERRGFHPSTLCEYLIELPRGEHPVSIFGVDHNKSKTFYNDKTYTHNWGHEEKIIKMMVDNFPDWRMYT